MADGNKNNSKARLSFAFVIGRLLHEKGSASRMRRSYLYNASKTEGRVGESGDIDMNAARFFGAAAR